MKLESPSISQKRFFCLLQTLNILQHRNELNLYSVWRNPCPAWSVLSVVSLLLLLFFFFFFCYFFCNPSPGAAESFSTQFRKNKAFTQWLRWNGEDIQPRAELGPLNTTLAFPACLCLQLGESNPYLARLYT